MLLNNISTISNSHVYELALKRLEEIFDADVSSKEGMEAEQLSELIIEYEEKNFPLNYAHADEYFYDI